MEKLMELVKALAETVIGDRSINVFVIVQTNDDVKVKTDVDLNTDLSDIM